MKAAARIRNTTPAPLLFIAAPEYAAGLLEAGADLCLPPDTTEKNIVSHAMVACDPGVGLYAAEMMREHDQELQLFCLTPHEEQAAKWAPYLRERYFDMLIKCTHMSAVSLHKRSGKLKIVLTTGNQGV